MGHAAGFRGAPGVPGAGREQGTSARAWDEAVAARAALEQAAAGQRTRAAYTAVMNGFRQIYHADPADLYAPRAVDAVAELLAEEGRELQDRKALHDAAGQYEFLAKAYPASSLAAPGLGKALVLLGPGEADDATEVARVRELLQQRYPRSAAAKSAGEAGRPRDVAGVDAASREGAAKEGGARESAAGEGAAAGVAGAKAGAPAASVQAAGAPNPEPVDDQRRAPGAAPAMVTGIRHWSTASYTRVAIDLGGEVEFKAARVEHPDRIFFDLHGAKLAPGLAGKSFAITDDGFLKMIRAGQFGADVTRIVLDVQPVAEYSAFLLPNPTRLIIDVHGKQGGETASQPVSGSGGQQTGSAGQVGAGVEAGTGAGGRSVGAPSAMHGGASPHAAEPAAEPSSSVETAEAPPAPVERIDPAMAGHPAKGSAPVSSSLPPMPVTDGSASFGLPAKRTVAAAGSQPVARPRVVVPAKPTAAKPVPNSVASAVPEGNREVAAVSEGPGVIEATATPTSRPVVERTKPSGRRGREQGTADEHTVADRDGVSAEAGAPPMAGTPASPAPPTADGQSTLMRALGLKIGRIVIDAGHGGHDSGTLGVDGIQEKDVVLDVALRLGKLLHDRLGAEIVYTRADDTFIPLETRTAIANKAQADLFISVHANSSQDPDARGVEVYYLNFTSDPEAMQVASRENAVSSQRVNQLSDLVKKIALKDKIDESRELAADVDAGLYSGLKKGNEGLKDRGVKKAPFVVLIGANMPSILAEISFVTNPDDADELSRPAYRERVAESLYSGVARYAAAINGSPGGTRKATRMEHAALKQQTGSKN